MDVRPSMEWVDFVNRQNFLQFHHGCTHTSQEPRNLEYRYVLTVEFEGDMKDKRKYIPIRVLQSGEGCRQIWFLESKRLLQHHRLLWLFVWPFSFQLPISLSSYEVEYSPMRYKLKKYINYVRWCGVGASTESVARMDKLTWFVFFAMFKKFVHLSFSLVDLTNLKLSIGHENERWDYNKHHMKCPKSHVRNRRESVEANILTTGLWRIAFEITLEILLNDGEGLELDRLSGEPWI